MAANRWRQLAWRGLGLAGLGILSLRALTWVGIGPRLSDGLVAVAGETLLVLCYGVMLVAFARSLLPGREPLISAVARQVRGSLPPAIVRYTRAVTIAWAVLFLTQIVMSLTLLLAAPLAAWTFYVTWVSAPLVLAMVTIEYTVRRIVLRAYPHSRFRDVARAMRMALHMARAPQSDRA